MRAVKNEESYIFLAMLFSHDVEPSKFKSRSPDLLPQKKIQYIEIPNINGAQSSGKKEKEFRPYSHRARALPLGKWVRDRLASGNSSGMLGVNGTSINQYDPSQAGC